MKDKKEMEIVVTVDDSQAKSTLERLSNYLNRSFGEEEKQKINIDTKEAKLKIEELKKEISELSSFAQSLTKEELASGYYTPQLEQLKSKKMLLEDLQSTLEDTNKETVEINHNFDDFGDKIGNAFTKASKKARMFILSVFSIRTIWALISKASSAYLSQNEETSNKIEAMWIYLGNLLGPIIERIVSWLEYGIAYLNVFTKALLGVDLLAKSINTSVTSTTKEMQKMVSSMDEVVNLQQPSETGGVSGGNPSDVLEDINDLELDPKIVSFLEDLADTISDVWKLASGLYDLLVEAFGPAGAGVIIAGLALLIGSSGFGGLAKILAGGFIIDFIYKGMTGRDLIDDLNGILSGFNALNTAENIYNETQKVTSELDSLIIEKIKDKSLTLDNLSSITQGVKDHIDELTRGVSGNREEIEKSIEETDIYSERLKRIKTYLEENMKQLDKNSEEYKEQQEVLDKINETMDELDGAKADLTVELDAETSKYETKIGNLFSDLGSRFSNAFKTTLNTLGPGKALTRIFGFASGGYPEEGQMFFARENGPELVGTIGGSTAVVNNTQIVDAVSAGVANAVASVLTSQESSSSNATYLYINGSEFAKAIYSDMEQETNRRNRSTSIRRV